MRRLQSLWTAALALGLSARALAEPVTAKGLGLPPDASADGYRIDELIHETVIFIAVMFGIMVVWMLLAAILHGRKHEAFYTHVTRRGQIVSLVVIGVLVAADADLYIDTMRDMSEVFWNFAPVDADPNAIKIEIDAHQWAWSARYAGPDGKFNTPDDVVTLNDIRAPVGAPVIFEITSTDVIHSLYFPNFRVKMDAMPGMVNHLWLRPKETGEYEVGCAQHCGINHYKMRALFTVLPEADYQRWLREASANAERAYDPADTVAHWGWDWTNPRPIEGDQPPLPKAATARAAGAAHEEGI